VPQIIASTYEIQNKIGSGGGGVVYLARHLRLDKLVVVKADKRKITAKPEVLRREVDALKNLSHTYIPQVYDFVVEGESVYTVMDFIEGESLDKALKRGERAGQAQIVEWACELLEALVYLHGRPPHGILHADIKPANVMLTPQGDIRLIDYNISLALGEEGAVSVGKSAGYASPEHWGISFSSDASDTQSGATTVIESAETDVSEPRPSSSHSAGKRVMLDVRSDIYGLGATLYHLLTGNRPARHVKDIIPLSDKDYSYGIAEIINKAMDPNPDLRFQTAAEMLYAFEHLRENDPRVKRHKRARNAAVAVCTALFLLGAFTAFTGLKRMQSGQTSLTLAEYSAGALADGDPAKAIKYALDALPKPGVFTPEYAPPARNALAAALGVYDFADGFKAHKLIELPSEVLKTAVSPDGKTAAAVTLGTLTIFDTETAGVIAELPTEASALADALFISDTEVIFAGSDGVCVYDIPARQPRWTGKPATKIAVSADGSTFAAVYKDDGEAVVYNADGNILTTVGFGGKHQRVTVNDGFADPNDNLLALSSDGARLAASFSDGALVIYDLSDPDGTVELYGESEFFHFEGGFSGDFFAFSATGAESSVFAVVDTRYSAQTGGFESASAFGVLADERGIYLSNEDVVVKLDPVSGEQEEVAYMPYDVVAFDVSQDAYKYASVVSATDGAVAFFDKAARRLGGGALGARADFVKIAGDHALAGSRDSPFLRILKRERNPVFAVYDATYAHDEARVNADGTRIMLFSYAGFRVYGPDGRLYNETDLPDAGEIYDQQYRRVENDAYLEVVYNDGSVDSYSGDTGEFIGQGRRDPPDPSLREEFFTDEYRIEAPLHGAPTAYDRTTGKQLRELEKNAYLTYVTQAGGYIVTEYVTALGERYALLLDENLETLARLPQLTDIVGDALYFDDQIGNIREGRMIPVGELLELARTWLPP
jgi:predicted Ser/Thr protein kinase